METIGKVKSKEHIPSLQQAITISLTSPKSRKTKCSLIIQVEDSKRQSQVSGLLSRPEKFGVKNLGGL